MQKPSPISPMPGGAKPITNKLYTLQGWNAAREGFSIEQVPYYYSSTAWTCWRRGFNDFAGSAVAS